MHYHISMNSGTQGSKVLIEENWATSRERFEKTVMLLKDLTGSPIESKSENVVIFESGDSVKWRPCQNDCMDNKNLAIKYNHDPLQVIGTSEFDKTTGDIIIHVDPEKVRQLRDSQ